jgi:hypothetical protein
MRSFDYRPHLVDKFTPDLRTIQSRHREEGAFQLDYPRLQVSIASVVRGLYFHETGKKLLLELSGPAWANMLTENYSRAPFLEPSGMAEQGLPANYVGANPRVFQYAFNTSKNGSVSLCRLRFYEGNPIYVTWKDDG